MKTIVKVIFAVIVAVVMFMGALMIYEGARENAIAPDAKNDFSLGIIGGADGPTSIIVSGPFGPITITDGGRTL